MGVMFGQEWEVSEATKPANVLISAVTVKSSLG